MRKIVARYKGKCSVCSRVIEEGETVYWEKGRGIWHIDCEKTKPVD